MVTVLQRLGLPDEHITTIAWNDLDRVVVPDHLTSLWIPSLGASVATRLMSLRNTMVDLRAKCPWDAEQTHVSLARYVIEESYELVEAIHRFDHLDDDASLAHLVEELGDVLFQVVFHACLGEESGLFNLADVAQALERKLVTRHPHVFGDRAGRSVSSQDVVRNWELLKMAERAARGDASEGPMDGLTSGLPALSYAAKVLKRARSAGHAVPAVHPAPADFGVALLSIVAAARDAGVDAEEALRLAAATLRDEVAGTAISSPAGP